MSTVAEVAFQFLPDKGKPPEPSILTYGGDTFTVEHRDTGVLLLECSLSSATITDINIYQQTLLSFAVASSRPKQLVAMKFEAPYEADDFAEWLRPGPGNLLPNHSKHIIRPHAVVPDQNITTLLEIPGYRIVRSLGIVTGINVRSAGPWGNFTAGLKSTLFGGSLNSFITLSRDARRSAYNSMVSAAAKLGANAILGVRYDSNDVIEGATELMCYGTAVIVEAIQAPTVPDST